ncbi:alternative ribosome rescue aminoacyl-tRNA hydrolase ArfB [Prochlorococcus marinus]|uniref:alternative ribosome rescue aminoacyl-tRNA hydrolase ArfB n=1 Tax=Prochlorococcus marinus TaxID=1219 RepID=UPI0022B5C592|nr:alternative ribosome rescue aminoacyl-tRNA hydrolase ArfB [Prochlorococcus marinus]
MNLTINSKLEIPVSEIQWRFSRSSGAGGQNVNKTDSRVEIVFNVSESKTLTQFQKHRISIQNEVKLINGCICIAVQNKRTQYKNRQLALSRLASTLRELLKPPPKKRRETIPTRSSQRKRIESKKKRGELKKNRQSKRDY